MSDRQFVKIIHLKGRIDDKPLFRDARRILSRRTVIFIRHPLGIIKPWTGDLLVQKVLGGSLPRLWNDPGVLANFARPLSDVLPL